MSAQSSSVSHPVGGWAEVVGGDCPLMSPGEALTSLYEGGLPPTLLSDVASSAVQAPNKSALSTTLK